jgi:RNA polymerase sigma factor (sigma-70 family)
VPSIVSKYVRKRVGFTMSSEVVSDLLQQGYLGLRRAAEKFDHSRGFAFSTYAHSWIYQGFTRWHNSHDRTIYIPENTANELLYRQRHGKPSKAKTGSLSNAVMQAAAQSFMVGSIDQKVANDEDGAQLADLMSSENLLLPKERESGVSAEDRLRKLMNECGIAPQAQEVVVAYAKRGRMSIVASRMSLSPKNCRGMYDDAVKAMKTRVQAKQASVSAAWADRLSKSH